MGPGRDDEEGNGEDRESDHQREPIVAPRSPDADSDEDGDQIAVAHDRGRQSARELTYQKEADRGDHDQQADCGRSQLGGQRQGRLLKCRGGLRAPRRCVDGTLGRCVDSALIGLSLVI